MDIDGVTLGYIWDAMAAANDIASVFLFIKQARLFTVLPKIEANARRTPFQDLSVGRECSE